MKTIQENFSYARKSVTEVASTITSSEVSIYNDLVAPVANWAFVQPHSLGGAGNSVWNAGAWSVNKVVQASNFSRFFNMLVATVALGHTVKQGLGAGASGGNIWNPLADPVSDPQPGVVYKATGGNAYADSARNLWRSWTNFGFKKPEVGSALSTVWTNGRGNFSMDNLPLLSGFAVGLSFIGVAATQFTNVSEGYKTLALAALAVSVFACKIKSGYDWLRTPKAAAPITDAELKLNALFDAIAFDPSPEVRSKVTATRLVQLVNQHNVNGALEDLIRGFLELGDNDVLPMGEDLVAEFGAKLKARIGGSNASNLVGALEHAVTAMVTAKRTAMETAKSPTDDIKAAINDPDGVIADANKVCNNLGYTAAYNFDKNEVKVAKTK